MEKRVIIIAGPTASGKTDLAIKIALKLGTEIISADSRQVYKFTDIGTAKPTGLQLQRVRHHLISIIPPERTYNAALFQKESAYIIEQLHNNGKIPVVCGGTGLYLRALTDGISEGTDYDPAYREELMSIRVKEGNEYLYNLLLQNDPVSASKMLPQNWKRVIRALEVVRFTGKPIWEHHSVAEKPNDYKFFYFVLDPPRELLYTRINQRVLNMMAEGLYDEVTSLIQRGLHYSTNNSLNTVGYKELIEYTEGKFELETAVELIKRNTRRYAKRQMTWFRNINNVILISSVNQEEQIEIISKVISV